MKLVNEANFNKLLERQKHINTTLTLAELKAQMIFSAGYLIYKSADGKSFYWDNGVESSRDFVDRKAVIDDACEHHYKSKQASNEKR